MIRHLKLVNFRSFPEFHMDGLNRINLLVGSNNSGKTSILEAIELMLAQGDARSIWGNLQRRGERLGDDDERRSYPELDICRLFYGYELNTDSFLEILSTDDHNRETSLRVTLIESTEWEQPQLSLLQDSAIGPLALSIKSIPGLDSETDLTILPLSEKGGLPTDIIRRRPLRKEENRRPTSFVSTSSLQADEVTSLLSRYILNPEEEFILNALRIIEKDIERIAPISIPSGPQNISSKGGVVVKFKNLKTRLPIGTMGDGVWRLLALSLSLAKTKGGVLLIDEIDTGLHYTVMENMWKLVFRTAQLNNIQIFATSHSSDCWKSLAAVCRDPSFGKEATIQHIEKGKSAAKSFSGPEIIIASERDFEVR